MFLEGESGVAAGRYRYRAVAIAVKRVLSVVCESRGLVAELMVVRSYVYRGSAD